MKLQYKQGSLCTVVHLCLERLVHQSFNKEGSNAHISCMSTVDIIEILCLEYLFIISLKF